jgi:hypothetical protein
MHLWLRIVTFRHDDLGCGFYKRMHSKKLMMRRESQLKKLTLDDEYIQLYRDLA